MAFGAGVGGAAEIVSIIFRARDETGSVMNNIRKQYQKLHDNRNELLKTGQVESRQSERSRADLVKQAKDVQALSDTQLGWRGVMGLSLNRLREVQTQQGGFATTTGRVAARIRTLSHGMGGFRMEMLGVMFFGMAIQRMFMSMLQPALQLTGIFDLISNILALLFLPIALALIDPLLAILDWVMAMPDSLKFMLGLIAIAGVVFGSLTMILGQMALGFGSLIIAIGPILAFLPEIIAVASAILGIFFASTSLIPTVGAVGDEAENTGNVLGRLGADIQGFIGSIKDFFGGAFNMIKDILGPQVSGIFSGFVGIAKGALMLLTGDWDKGWEMIRDNISKIIGEIGPIIIGIINSVIDFLKTLPFVGDVITIIQDLLTIVYSAITGDWEKVQNALDEIIHTINKWVEWGRYIGEKLISGVTEYISDNFWGLIMKTLFGSPVTGPVGTIGSFLKNGNYGLSTICRIPGGGRAAPFRTYGLPPSGNPNQVKVNHLFIIFFFYKLYLNHLNTLFYMD